MRTTLPERPGWVPATAVGLEVAIALGVLAVLLKLILVASRLATRKTRFSYVPFSANLSQDTLVTDCTHPRARTLTHHKGQRNPARLTSSDTSTGLVLNAIKASAWSAGQAYKWCQLPSITTNHFDVDRDAFTALKLVCWLNSEERSRFSAPYEARDCDAKFAHFLPRFGAVLANPESGWQEWQDEYREVVSGFDLISQDPCAVELHRPVGLAVVRAPEPTLHYYSIFSYTVGYDTVLTMYDGQRYEVESKYTQFVNVFSRPVWPRIDMAPLARVLNAMEGRALEPQLRWSCPRFTDTGPVLRIEDTARPLSKAQRYGHPYGRPLHSSNVPPATVVALVVSFLEYGMQGLKPKRGGWTWDELQSLNSGIAWQAWEDTALAQWERGELDSASAPAPLGSRASAGGDSGGALLPAAAISRQGSYSSGGAGLSPRIGVAMTLGGGLWAEPSFSEPSSILSPDDVRALAGAVPARLAPGRWRLLYGSSRDGVSLRTLYRKASGAGVTSTLLVVREAGAGGHVVGAFAAEPWVPGPRFYGTGETFVFTLQPVRVRYAWQRPRPQAPLGARSSGGGATGPYASQPGGALSLPHHRHSVHHAAGGPGSPPAVGSAGAALTPKAAPTGLDFFQFSTHEGLGVGGAGAFALWLDNELLEGASYPCDTFGSPQLTHKEEFRVASVELWQI
ncbi:hypothetical protein GPECTOR_4g973 [Gonium pectorale]|uniref:Oxidation resistance protein 1 n=1 Tax=Gonium pectorale TaxID=33097 RepID=A0A150GYI9_GONPE|nr:hypothetical protein GPECTOR_4g973 [Gonium pectorale]|eukprot:KXZ54901.1 hypothetical protein GPECTOR_4g973 [Gonium pectorale]